MFRITKKHSLYLAFMAITLVFSISVFGINASNNSIRDIGEVVSLFEAGEKSKAIKLLDSGFPKPISSVLREGEDGREFVINIYQYGNYIMLTYRCEGDIYAVCAIVGRERSSEKWYFCDVDLLVEHIHLSMNLTNEPVGEVSEKSQSSD